MTFTPPPLDAEALEHGRRLFAQECRFMLGVAGLDQIPESALPEIAFAGRSNVGKSSLVNALTGRKTLAKISNTPGRTQQLNFFALGERLVMVDLPGYGYAKVPKPTVEAWTRLLFAYLRGRVPLRRVFVLVDARHGLMDADRKALKMLDDAAVSYQVVLTKVDKAKSPDALVGATAAELAGHVAAFPRVLATSAVKGTGIAELRAVIAGLAANH